MVDDYGVAHIGKCGAVCDGVTNVDAVIQKELSAGCKRLWLPAKTRWQPDRNYVPGGLEVRGEDWLSVVIEVKDTQTEHMVIGPYTELVNVSIFDTVEPGVDGPGQKSKRPIRRFFNLRPEDVNITHFAYTAFMSMVGMPGLDHCAFTVNGCGVGDLNFVGVDGDATGMHWIVNGLDTNKYGTAGLMEACGRGPGLHILGRETNKQTYGLLRIQQTGEGPLLMLESGAKAGEVVVIMLGHDATGQCFHVYQHTGKYTGSPIALDMGRGGGTYTDSPFWYRNGEGPLQFELLNDGSIASEQMTTLEHRIAELERKLGD